MRTVRSEQLKECCEFANCEYKRLLAGSPCFMEFQDC